MNKQLIEDERHPNPMSVEALQDRMRDWLSADYVAFVVVEGGHPVAYCLYRDDGDHYYLRQLFVDRGRRRQGIATQLLDWMYERQWGGKRVRLDVLAHNRDAIAFYQARGFRTAVHRMER